MTDLFISYARKDRPVAARIAASLAEHGWEVFWDRNIEAGAEWNEEIQRTLHEARCALVLWSDTNPQLWHERQEVGCPERLLELSRSLPAVAPLHRRGCTCISQPPGHARILGFYTFRDLST